MWAKAELLAYEEIRSYEELQIVAASVGAKIA